MVRIARLDRPWHVLVMSPPKTRENQHPDLKWLLSRPCVKIHAESITALLCQRSSEDFWRLVFDDGFRALESLDLQLPGVPEGEQKQQHTPQKARLNPYTKKKPTHSKQNQESWKHHELSTNLALSTRFGLSKACCWVPCIFPATLQFIDPQPRGRLIHWRNMQFQLQSVMSMWCSIRPMLEKYYFTATGRLEE